ncbi:NAD(P)/FAD-dependent oxidoreductase [Oceanivirga miroungae]|uniref:Oxidoreductase, FAD-binding n=1 Tax=Oceanivirga miroungae TaxID=1130046 RepID=A0A6I8M887_9FUSO|nr:hypothetical protein [Oceanivirga miroungae]VWL85660.1 oxidoreductase, FAD-binding [Oceanivirga miroungae]
MIRITGITVDIDHNEENIKDKIREVLKNRNLKIDKFRISNKAIDARAKLKVPKYIYTVDIEFDNEDYYVNDNNIKKIIEAEYIIPDLSWYKGKRPIIVGSGPAGIFAGLILARANLKPIIIERGEKVENRVKDVYNFFETGKLKTESNVQFGEGGAGTFSDGKLTTNTHNDRIKVVVDELIKAGADKEIAYISKPHIGTDVLVDIVKNIRHTIESLGGEYRFNSQFIDYETQKNKLKSLKIKQISGNIYQIDTNHCILALGHSARDTFYMLRDKNMTMSKKIFAVGFRIEHKQSFIDKSQYRAFRFKLPPAEYKLNVRANNRGVYTFCMCPGGVVVPSSSEENRLVVNGMSYNARSLENANSAVLVNVNPSDLGEDVLSGVEFQREIEEKAFKLGGSNYHAPVQLVTDYINNRKSTKILDVVPSYSIGYKLANLNEILPEYLNISLREGLSLLNNKLKGFSENGAILTGVESRSSSPIRIDRDEQFNSSVVGIIPCGEGAGYAGGIMSAAVDGIRCAEKIIEMIENEK